MFGVGKLVLSILQLWKIFFSWKWAIEFPSGSGICFRSVLRYFLKPECGVVETAHRESLWAGGSWGAGK